MAHPKPLVYIQSRAMVCAFQCSSGHELYKHLMSPQPSYVADLPGSYPGKVGQRQRKKLFGWCYSTVHAASNYWIYCTSHLGLSSASYCREWKARKYQSVPWCLQTCMGLLVMSSVPSTGQWPHWWHAGKLNPVPQTECVCVCHCVCVSCAPGYCTNQIDWTRRSELYWVSKQTQGKSDY